MLLKREDLALENYREAEKIFIQYSVTRWKLEVIYDSQSEIYCRQKNILISQKYAINSLLIKKELYSNSSI